MSGNSILFTVIRVVCGVFAGAMLLIGIGAAFLAAFNQTQLLLGLLLTFCAGWVAFRQRTLIAFNALFWLCTVLVARVSAPWLPLVTAVESLKPGTPRTEVVARLKPWVHESQIPLGPDGSGMAQLHQRVEESFQSLICPPEAVVLSFRENRLEAIQLYCD
jgi:hypothetical protein